MSNSQLIYEYLDTGLNDLNEDILFKELYENKDFREEFYTMVKFEGAAAYSFANSQVPVSVTSDLFRNIGVSMPNNTVKVIEKERPILGFLTSIGTLSLFSNFRDYISAFLGLLIGGILTATIFMFTNNENISSNTSDVKTTSNSNFVSSNGASNNNFSNNNSSNNYSGNNGNNYTNSIIPITKSEDNQNNNSVKSNSIANNVSSNNSISINPNSNQFKINLNSISKEDLEKLSKLNLTEDIINNLGIMIIDNNNFNNNDLNNNNLNNNNLNNNDLNSNSNSLLANDIINTLNNNMSNNLNNSNPISSQLNNNQVNFNITNLINLINSNKELLTQQINQINIINNLTTETREKLFKENIYYIDTEIYENEKDFNDFTLTLSGIGFSQNSYENPTQSFSNNLRIGLLYSVASNHFIGVNFGNEQFVLPNQSGEFANKSTYFIGANYNYNMKFLEVIDGIYPSIGTAVNFATIGTITRMNIGLNLTPESRLSFGVFYEPTILFNNYRNLGENYYKDNIIIGVSYKLQ